MKVYMVDDPVGVTIQGSYFYKGKRRAVKMARLLSKETACEVGLRVCHIKVNAETVMRLLKGDPFFFESIEWIGVFQGGDAIGITDRFEDEDND